MKSLIIAMVLVSTTAFAQMQSQSQNGVNIVLSGRLNQAKGADIPSATSGLVDLNSVAGNLVHITGVSTITSFGVPSQAGIQRNVIFDGVLTLTYSSSVLVLPGSSNIVTAAGDSALVVSDSLTKWIVLRYNRRATAP